MILRGQAIWAKMTSLGDKLAASVCHPTKYVNLSLYTPWFIPLLFILSMYLNLDPIKYK